MYTNVIKLIKGVCLLLMMGFGMLQIAHAGSGSKTTYYYTDALGSVIMASDEQGNTLWRKRYDAYGNEEILKNNTGNDRIEEGYIGGTYDSETGLLYLGQRYYSPKLRRFISMDPVGFTASSPVSFNRYVYGNNNPHKYVDPDGRFPFIPYLVGLAIIGGDIALQSYFAPDVPYNSGAVQSIDILPGPVSTAVVGSKVGVTAGRSFWGGATKGPKALPSLQVPNAGGKIVSDVTKQDEVFFRVFSGDSTRGGFLTKVAPTSQRGAVEGLALPPGNSAEFIQQVLVPAGTRLQRSRALPAFGRRGGKEQFQLLDEIPNGNFGPGVPFK